MPRFAMLIELGALALTTLAALCIGAAIATFGAAVIADIIQF